MDLNDSTLFTPTISSDDNPFEFVEESAIQNKPGAVSVMSGYEVSPVTKTTCDEFLIHLMLRFIL